LSHRHWATLWEKYHSIHFIIHWVCHISFHTRLGISWHTRNHSAGHCWRSSGWHTSLGLSWHTRRHHTEHWGRSSGWHASLGLSRLTKIHSTGHCWRSSGWHTSLGLSWHTRKHRAKHWGRSSSWHTRRHYTLHWGRRSGWHTSLHLAHHIWWCWAHNSSHWINGITKYTSDCWNTWCLWVLNNHSSWHAIICWNWSIHVLLSLFASDHSTSVEITSILRVIIVNYVKSISNPINIRLKII